MKKSRIVVTILIWVFLICVFFLIYNYISSRIMEEKAAINYTRFTELVVSGNIKQINIEGSKIFGRTKNRERFFTYVPIEVEDATLMPLLHEHNVQITAIPVVTRNYSWVWYLVCFFIFPIIFLVFFMRSMNSSMNIRDQFSKSKAKMIDDRTRKVSFDDVAGIDLEEVMEIVDYLKDPKKFNQLGGRVPKGILLTGRPGTGKTLIARAIAGEANVLFFSISGSDFVEMFVGVGASRVRDLFEQARKAERCVIFIDEIDAVGRKRGSGSGNSHDEREQTLNQLLVELDGIESGMGIVIIAATNRADILDQALLRPGRFDLQIEIQLPDVNGREAILKVHAKKIRLDPNANLRIIAEETKEATGADLENIVNLGAIIARRLNKERVEEEDLRSAHERVVAGKESKRFVSDSEREIIAVHETGHALVGILQKDFSSILRSVTAIPHGDVGGFTWFEPAEDIRIKIKCGALAELRMMLGGRAAEEIILKDISNGAASDIQRATEFARTMVCTWGFGKKGPVAVKTSNINWFYELSGGDVSEDTKREIDEEVEEMISTCFKEAKTIISGNMEIAEAIKIFLIKKKKASGKEVLEIVEQFGVDKVKTV